MKSNFQCGLTDHQRMLKILERYVKKYPELNCHFPEIRKMKKELKDIKKGKSEYDELVFGERIFILSFPIIDYVWKTSKRSIFLTPNTYRYLARILLQLKNMAAWREKKETFVPYNREDKDGLNAMVFFVLLENDRALNGNEYNSEACVAFIMKRLLRSAFLGDSSPENKEWYCGKVEDYEEARKRYVLRQVLNEMPFVLVSRLFSLASKISERELQLFRKAQAIVNYLEYDHIMQFFLEKEAIETEDRLKKVWDKNEYDPLFSRELYELFGLFSTKLRNIIRWQKYSRTVECNLCGHMLETAVYSWFMAFEQCDILSDPDVSAAELFWIGIYHDLPEVFTGDVDSPLKDGIVFKDNTTLRHATEDHERYVMERCVYPYFCEEVQRRFRDNVSLESLKKEYYHKLIKKADYFSADWELIYNLNNGSCSAKKRRIIKNSIKMKRTPKTTAILRKMMFIITFKRYYDI